MEKMSNIKSHANLFCRFISDRIFTIFSTPLIVVCIGIGACPVVLSAITISETPLETSVHSPPANLMMVLDNSGSMDWEFMTPEREGLFQERMYLFPETDYHPALDHRYGAGHSLSPLQRRLWRSQWAGYNRLYFDPNKKYRPWPATERYAFGPADLNRPWSNPMRTVSGHSRIDLCAPFFSIRSGVTTLRISNAHYFTHGDTNHNGIRDPGEIIYLVTWLDDDNDGILDVSGLSGRDRRRYYRFMDDGDDLVEDNELELVVDDTEKHMLRPARINAEDRFAGFQSDIETLQNFANWYSYYRRRLLTLKAVVAFTLKELKQVRVGLCAVNGQPRVGMRPVGVIGGEDLQDASPELLRALYNMQSEGLTPLQNAVDRVGRYFHGERSAGFSEPFSPTSPEGACQQYMALVVSDGFWNGRFSGVGNADGAMGAPYADGFSDTLADVAAYYYDHDLRPDVEDTVFASGCGDVSHQHLTTLALSFGLDGTIKRFDMDGNGVFDTPGYAEDPCLSRTRTLPGWPQPIGVSGQESSRPAPAGADTAMLIDDLWHATINGHGVSFTMDQSSALVDYMHASAPQIAGEVTTTALTLNQEQLNVATILYRTTYDPTQWSGDVSAWSFRPGDDGAFGSILWRASEQFQQSGLTWDERRIVTYAGSQIQSQHGIPFRYDRLSPVQQLALGDQFDARQDMQQATQDLIAYIRGAAVPQFRSRSHPMGDVVHAKPVVVGNTLLVGANDGMLHAFDAQTGAERFAYVPNLVFDHLKSLSDPAYPGRHRFYVDGPLWAGEVQVGNYQRRTYLVGGLGKGGRGYFCLLAGVRHRPRQADAYGSYEWTFHLDQLGSQSGEEDTGQVVQWEYPDIDPSSDGIDNNADGMADEPGEIDPHMGFSFSQGYAVNANCAADSYRPVVIFGNGYDSPSGKAVLYVLDAATGEIVRKIDTGAGLDNGLSTPALIDVNRDHRVDYAYAGDLAGNMWKFDLTAQNPDRWGVAYGVDLNGDHTIDAAQGDRPQPLFQTRGQSITGRPDIMAMANACNPQATGYMVIFGTGRYFAVGDQSDTRRQSIYGIWDYGDDSDDSEYLGYLTDRSSGMLSTGLRLVQQRVLDQTYGDDAARQISQSVVHYDVVEDPSDPNQNDDPVQHVGWFLDFPIAPDPLANPGERVIGKVTLRGGKAVLVSLVPEQTLCRSGGVSWIYLLNGCNGGQTSTTTEEFLGAKSINQPIYADPVIAKDPAQPHLDRIILPDAAGGIIQVPFKGEPWGKAYWWQNIE